MTIPVVDADDPPLELATRAVRAALEAMPARIAFAGPAGAGKSTVCSVIAGVPARYPILNHADPMKAELIEWLLLAGARAFRSETEAWDGFCEFMGIDPQIAYRDLMELLGPLFETLWELVHVAEREAWPLEPFIALRPEEGLAEKVAFVDSHRAAFRTPLQRYGTVLKELAADPEYWVKQTISRGLSSPICLNGDTRFREEAQALRACGWHVIYLAIDGPTQRARRPEMTPSERQHFSEHAIAPIDCDWTIDARAPLGRVLLEVADYLTPRRHRWN